MNGSIKKPALGLCLGALTLVTGCVAEYRTCVDPCWPERYNFQARKTVHEAFNHQAWNGHAFDQTVWTEYFERNSPKLTDAGKERLKYLAHRRPCPDPHVFVQKTCDAMIDGDRVNSVRAELTRLSECFNIATAWNVEARAMPETCLLPMRGAPNLYVTPSSAQTNLSALPNQPGTIPPGEGQPTPTYGPQPSPIQQPPNTAPEQR